MHGFMNVQLMLYSEIIVVCSEIRTKHINTLCGQKVEFETLNLVIHIVTTGFERTTKSVLSHYLIGV
jgi:hypothetical protein